MTQEQLERRVMELLLSGDNMYMDTLKAQFSSALVYKREFSGFGFFTEFQYPENSRIGNISGRIMGPSVQYKHVDDGMGFVLFINDGGIDTLEGFSYVENWYKEDILHIDGDTFFWR